MQPSTIADEEKKLDVQHLNCITPTEVDINYFVIRDLVNNARITYHSTRRAMENVKYQVNSAAIPVYRMGRYYHEDSLGFINSLYYRLDRDHFQHSNIHSPNTKFILPYGFNRNETEYNPTGIPSYCMSGFICSDSIMGLVTFFDQTVWYYLDVGRRIRDDCAIIHNSPSSNHLLYLTKQRINDVTQWASNFKVDPCMKSSHEDPNGQWQPIAFIEKQKDFYKIVVNSDAKIDSTEEKIRSLVRLKTEKKIQFESLNDSQFHKKFSLSLPTSAAELLLPEIINQNDLLKIKNSSSYNFQTKVICRAIFYFSNCIKEVISKIQTKNEDNCFLVGFIICARSTFYHQLEKDVIHIFNKDSVLFESSYFFYYINSIYSRLMEIYYEILKTKSYSYEQILNDNDLKKALQWYYTHHNKETMSSEFEDPIDQEDTIHFIGTLLDSDRIHHPKHNKELYINPIDYSPPFPSSLSEIDYSNVLEKLYELIHLKHWRTIFVPPNYLYKAYSDHEEELMFALSFKTLENSKV